MISKFCGDHKIWSEPVSKNSTRITESISLELRPEGYAPTVMEGNYYLGILQIPTPVNFIEVRAVSTPDNIPLGFIALLRSDTDEYYRFQGPFSSDLVYKLYADTSISPHYSNKANPKTGDLNNGG